MSKKRMTPLTALRDIHDLLYLQEEAYKTEAGRGRWINGCWRQSHKTRLYYDPGKALYWNREMLNDIADIIGRVIPRPTRACRVDTYPWRKSPGRKKTHKR